MRRSCLCAMVLVGGLSAPALGQSFSTGKLMSTDQLMTTDQLPTMSMRPDADADADSSFTVPTDTSVSFIDSATPRTQIRLRYDLDYHNRRHTRGEYLFAKGGLPGAPGMPLPEPNVAMQELTAYVEVALTNRFSFFVDQAARWVNPQVNANEGGWGDFNFGLKWSLWSSETYLTAFQLRAYAPMAQGRALGTEHFSLEPAFLASVHLAKFLLLEGEARFWVPIGGEDFSSSLVRYGLGLSYGQRSAKEIWVTPIAEVVGWTMLDGMTQVVHPAGFEVVNASGDTIVNAYLGARLGLGERTDVYLGYGRSLTGHKWFRDTARFEFRFFF